MKLVKSLFALSAVALAIAGVPAHADIAVYTLTQFNVPGFTSPFGTVTVNRTSTTTATLTYDAAAGYVFIDGGAAAANINATTWTLGSISGTPGAGFGVATYSDGGAGNEDGWGSFNQTINQSDGFADGSVQIVFSITDTSGTWADAASVLIANTDPNGGHHFVAAHIAGCTDSAGTQIPCTPTSTNVQLTGFATDNGP
jgi:hypothetical protein